MRRHAVLMVALVARAAYCAAGGDGIPPAKADPTGGLVELATTWNGRAFCAPRAATVHDLQVALASFVQAHPELAGHPNHEQTLRGLAERYPCDPAGLPRRGADARLRRAFEDIAAPLLSVSPGFSQWISMALPAGFQATPVYESGQAEGHYQRELVPAGETRSDWSEKITLRAERGLAARKDLGPQQLVEALGAGYREACPDSFVASSVAVAPVSGFDAFAAIFSCGSAPLSQGRNSETALVLAIRGQNDDYTLQWAERGMPWSTPMAIDRQAWLDRLDRLVPIRLCARAPDAAVAACAAQP